VDGYFGVAERVGRVGERIGWGIGTYILGCRDVSDASADVGDGVFDV